MNPNRIRNPTGHWPAHSGDVHELLGLTHHQALPHGGMPERVIQGVRVWVDSIEDAKAAGRFHRVRCQCPSCGQVMSVGRLHQHTCKHSSLATSHRLDEQRLA